MPTMPTKKKSRGKIIMGLVQGKDAIRAEQKMQEMEFDLNKQVTVISGGKEVKAQAKDQFVPSESEPAVTIDPEVAVEPVVTITAEHHFTNNPALIDLAKSAIGTIQNMSTVKIVDNKLEVVKTPDIQDVVDLVAQANKEASASQPAQLLNIEERKELISNITITGAEPSLEEEMKEIVTDMDIRIRTACANYVNALAKKDEAKKLYEDYDNAVKELHDVAGMRYMFQDTQGTVYKVDKAEGTFVSFKEVEIKRTRRKHLGEKQGSLSLTDAKANGFILE